MTQVPTTVILAVSLIASFLSLGLFSDWWWRLTVADRVFSGTAGWILMVVSTEPPFVWPYFAAGILYGRRDPIEKAWCWVFATGVAGGLLYACMVRASFSPEADLQAVLGFYCRYAFPTLFALLGFLIGRRGVASVRPPFAEKPEKEKEA